MDYNVLFSLIMFKVFDWVDWVYCWICYVVYSCSWEIDLFKVW